MNLKRLSEALPPQRVVIIVETAKGRKQCEIEGDTAYVWTYEGRTKEPFCKVHEITGWRECSGLDF